MLYDKISVLCAAAELFGANIRRVFSVCFEALDIPSAGFLLVQCLYHKVWRFIVLCSIADNTLLYVNSCTSWFVSADRFHSERVACWVHKEAICLRHVQRTERATPNDVDLNWNLHDWSFNLHVKFHGNLVDLSAICRANTSRDSGEYALSCVLVIKLRLWLKCIDKNPKNCFPPQGFSLI